MNNSIWADSVVLPSFPALGGELKTDVLIVGGGLAGILCAHRLRQDGVDCTLIEKDRICGGVTQNTTAKITSQHGLLYHKLLKRFGTETSRLYWQANEGAIAQYQNLANEILCDFQTKDNYIYSSDIHKLSAEMEALKVLGIPAEYVKDVNLPVPAVGAVRFRDQGQFNPLKLVMGLAGELRIFEHTQALEFKKDVVVTNHGNIKAKKIVIATHFPVINKHGSYFLKMYQQRSYVLALKDVGQVDGMYLGDDSDGLSFRSYGDLLLLGGGSHRTGKRSEGWHGLETFAKANYPSAKIVGRWATQDCMTLDEIPYIGQYSRNTPSVYVATGFQKWGMSTSMVAGNLLADLIQGRRNPYTEVFSTSRSILRPQLFVNGIESACNLLRPTAPRCPHLGCALQWNREERSWDCPCHGSRFSPSGELLDGPANGDMKKRPGS